VRGATALLLARTRVLGNENRELWARAVLSTLFPALDLVASLLPIFMYVRHGVMGFESSG